MMRVFHKRLDDESNWDCTQYVAAIAYLFFFLQVQLFVSL